MSEGKTSWAMATPSALYIIGASCFGLFALLSGKVGVGLESVPALSVMTSWLIAAAVGIFICGIIDLARGDILLGTIFIVFATLIFLGGGMSFNAAIALASQSLEAVGAGLALSGFIWLAIGIILFAFLFSVGRASWSLFLFVAVLCVAVIMLAISLMSGVLPGMGMMVIAGWLIGFFGLYCLYVGTVFVFNTVAGAPKLGIGKPLFK